MAPIKLSGFAPANALLSKSSGLFTLTFVIALLCLNTTSAQIQWTQLGVKNFAAGDIAYPSLAVDNNNVPYVCYSDYQVNGYKATVMRFTPPIGWVPVGGAAFSADAAYFTSLAIDKSNTPYVAFQDKANGYRASVMKYNGSAWVTVGTSGFSDSTVDQTIMAVDNNGTPYVAFRDGSDGAKVTVMKHNGTGWVTVGKKTFTASNARTIDFALDNNNVPYIAYTDEVSGYKGYVMKYNGTDWVVVGDTSVSSSVNVSNIELAFDKSNKPYVAYCHGCCLMVTKKYDGTNWVDVCNGSIIGGGPYKFSSFGLDKNDAPHFAVTNAGNGFKSSVYKFDGTNYVQVGGAWYASDPEVAVMAIHKDDIYVAYQTDYTLYQSNITVMRYGCKHPQFIINPCGVYTDTLTGKNVVVWQGDNTPNIDSYRVFREDNGSYVHVATLPGSSSRYVDQTASPSTKSYSYKITHTDGCDREMPFDSTVANRSVKLTFDYLLDNKASISWNTYEGMPNIGYTVRRSNNGSPFKHVAHFYINGNDTTYIDDNPPSGINRYRVETWLGSGCTSGGVAYNYLTSNIVSAWGTAIEDIAGNDNVSLAPNPTKGELHINAAQAMDKIQVFDLTGQNVLTAVGEGKQATVISVSELPQGIYLLKINDLYYKKFVKN